MKDEQAPKSKSSGITKDVKLSKELAALVGSDKMPRSEVVKKMWQIIKSRKLQDPENKQYFIVRDPDVRKVFNEPGVDKIKAFGMMKYLSKHITKL